MRPTRVVRHLVLAGLTLMALACARNDEAPAPIDAKPNASGAPLQSTSPGGQGVNIQFHSKPDPLQSGSNTIEVSVKQPDGVPVTDATVTAVFLMPAMPAMNMPAMRSDAPLTHVGNGTYRGTGQLSMGGTWNVNVTVSRGAETLGTSRFSIVAK
jgi:membrane fusion protein, copper/silver efflux system